GNAQSGRIIAKEASEAKRMTGEGFNGNAKEITQAAWDQANAFAKLTLIYGKIGYIPANLIGNIGLNLIQQGFLALPNLAKSVALNRTLGAHAGEIDRIMGSGVAHSLVAGTRRGLERPTRWLRDRMVQI